MKGQYPYLASLARDAHERGHPAMRTMYIEFPQDRAARYLDKQYMLGNALLVAPVFRQDGVSDYYLPKGTWVDFLTNSVVNGGEWRSDHVDFMHLPLLLREDTLLPTCDNLTNPRWSRSDPLTLHIGHLTANANTSITVPCDSGGAVTVRLSREGSHVTLHSDTANLQLMVQLRGTQRPLRFTNTSEHRDTEEGLRVRWVDSSKPLSFEWCA